MNENLEAQLNEIKNQKIPQKKRFLKEIATINIQFAMNVKKIVMILAIVGLNLFLRDAQYFQFFLMIVKNVDIRNVCMKMAINTTFGKPKK